MIVTPPKVSSSTRPFVPGEKVVAVNANHRVIRGIVVSQYTDPYRETRVEISYIDNGHRFSFSPTIDRVGRED